eukprot:TRINITY_DN2079_c0_g1_i1.p1 TRINITY_DN2079_c0_g1~~TRINITY_DN2079_c0_g1_i1.p1  ORF type:complete len:200 (-),score=33.09 TRINITY_DN2079_c0_g1_i1:24-623(-)
MDQDQKQLAKEYFIKAKDCERYANRCLKYLNQLSLQTRVTEACTDAKNHIKGIARQFISTNTQNVVNSLESEEEYLQNIVKKTTNIKALSEYYQALANTSAKHSLALAKESMRSLPTSTKRAYRLALKAREKLKLAKETTQKCYRIEEKRREGNKVKLRLLQKAKIINSVVLNSVTVVAYIYLALVFLLQLFGKPNELD